MQPKRQPKTLSVGTLRFRRVSEWRHVSGPISEGPFYVRVGADEPGVLYMPDADYLYGSATRASYMIRITASK